MRIARSSGSRAVASGFLITVLSGCGPAVDPAAKTEIDRRVAFLGQSPQRVAAPAVFEPRPLAVGQWTEHVWLNTVGRPSFETNKIVGREGDAFWFETVEESYFGKVIRKTLVSIPDPRNPQSIAIRAEKVRGVDGQVIEIPPEMLATRRSFPTVVGRPVVSWQGQPQEDALVPAGAFASCFRSEIDAPGGRRRAGWREWFHPVVPLSGLVARATFSGSMTVELVAYGDSGATSELP
jgi:hypothetical protein